MYVSKLSVYCHNIWRDSERGKTKTLISIWTEVHFWHINIYMHQDLLSKYIFRMTVFLTFSTMCRVPLGCWWSYLSTTYCFLVDLSIIWLCMIPSIIHSYKHIWWVTWGFILPLLSLISTVSIKFPKPTFFTMCSRILNCFSLNLNVCSFTYHFL